MSYRFVDNINCSSILVLLESCLQTCMTYTIAERTVNKLLMMDRRTVRNTRIGTLIVATIYLQLIQNRYMFRSFTVPQCSHQHCVQPVASDVEVVGYL